MAGEEDVLIELEAVQAVYGDDCTVLRSFPPYFHLHIMPRTADVSSQQFVEAVFGIRAGPKYPEEPPHIDLVESKGLDYRRQKHLISTIQDKARDLTSCLMLVSLCEEAVEKLSDMNHPDGDCPLCLYPLVQENAQNGTVPFMKLMSCFHCFHSECIVRWWNWIQKEKENDSSFTSLPVLQPIQTVKNQNDMFGEMGGSTGSCPVCRKVFHTKDFEHVLDLVGTHFSQLDVMGEKVEEEEVEVLKSHSESIRRQNFEAILRVQQENSGLIEPKRDLLVVPGMFLPQPATVGRRPNKDAIEHQRSNPTVSVDSNSIVSSSRPRSMKARNLGGRRSSKVHNPKSQIQQWVKRDNGSAN